MAGSLDGLGAAVALGTGVTGEVAATQVGDCADVSVVGVHAAQTKNTASTNLRINRHTTTGAKWFRGPQDLRQTELSGFVTHSIPVAMLTPADHHLLALAIRWLHVAAMSVAFGGAFLLAWLSYRTRLDHLLETAVRYEQAFWARAAVLVMTGIGNLGAFGVSLLEPSTSWGTTLIGKLWLVVALIAISLPRSLVVALLASEASARPADLRLVYTVTTAMFAAIVALATVLSHE